MKKINLLIIFCATILVSTQGFAIGLNAQSNRTDKDAPVFGYNIISFAPIHLTNLGAGIGLQYERVLDRKGYLSFQLPVVYTFSEDLGAIDRNNNINVVQFFPGIKFYPTTSMGKVRYGIGASVGIVNGERKTSEWEYDLNNGTEVYRTRITDINRLAIMLNHSLNVNATNHFYFGLEFGLGLYVRVEDSYLNNTDEGGAPSVQFAMRFGYRF